MKKAAPGAYPAIDHLDQFIAKCSVPAAWQELIRIRASQINGCAYCVHMHAQDALDGGEKAYRIPLIATWREAPNVFSKNERLLFQMTEEITLIHRQGLSEETYQAALKLFGEKETADIIMVIIGINVWNRIGVGLRLEPEIERAEQLEFSIPATGQ